MTVGIAVPTTVASRAAMNIPINTPASTAQRRRFDNIRTSGAAASSLIFVSPLFTVAKFRSVSFRQRRDLFHQMIGDRLMRPDGIAHFIEPFEVDRIAKTYP